MDFIMFSQVFLNSFKYKSNAINKLFLYIETLCSKLAISIFIGFVVIGSNLTGNGIQVAVDIHGQVHKTLLVSLLSLCSFSVSQSISPLSFLPLDGRRAQDCTTLFFLFFSYSSLLIHYSSLFIHVTSTTTHMQMTHIFITTPVLLPEIQSCRSNFPFNNSSWIFQRGLNL